MKRYKPLFERRKEDFKAWYSPSSDWFYQFNTNMIHAEISREQMGISEREALNSGYIRIYVYDNDINIMTSDKPDDQEFSSTQYALKDNTFPNKVHITNWEVIEDKDYIFPKTSFFFAGSIDDARVKK